ncbi:hypothetical protein HYPSUDRAFT_200251 [Hypholoma sublateritium FD-334 SS-4]|uniref:Uncharacterized protein n=1 Tax=Hypholoma sublateritium (strain FD-334 SS-4) TaxID=945553 RepID=A0A0D2P1E0_HYPSF|nr:hypothetical protein HYPSUDRAFT_200251 [Hypholoma sublateritium FD-334 SS-4]
MVIQSSFIYSLALLANALVTVIPATNASNRLALFVASDYVGAVFFAIAGIAPTLMVARVTLASNSTSDTEAKTVGISGIQLGEQNPNVQTAEVVGLDAVSEGPAA